MNQEKQNILIYPRQFFIDDLLYLRKHEEILFNVSFNETKSENQWLVRRGNQAEFEQVLQNRQHQMNSKQLNSKNLLLRSILLKNRLHPESNLLQTDYLIDGHLYLYFDEKNKTNSVSGYFRHNNQIINLDGLFLVGAEMQKIISVNANASPSEENIYERFLSSDYAKVRWAMTKKAIGEDNSWKRLLQLKIMIVGAGRTGELAFLELARLGVRHLSVCDGDNIELRNLGETKLITDQDIGFNKAEVLVKKVTKLRQTGRKEDNFIFRAIKSFNFEGIEAREIAKESDVIICCVDSDGARGYASYIASRYHKVLLDIGTGILPNQNGTLQRGYDVRGILPGDGCLKCFGGIDENQSELEIFNTQERDRQRKEGHQYRMGSLSSLNSLAVSEGILMLQDLCKGEIKKSTWIQFEKDSGRTVLSSLSKINGKCDCNNYS